MSMSMRNEFGRAKATVIGTSKPSRTTVPAALTVSTSAAALPRAVP